MPEQLNDNQRFRQLEIRAAKRDGGEVRGIISTEQPVRMFDWSRGQEFDEVLLTSGMELPANRQIPMLDNHRRGSINDQLGSIRDFQSLEADDSTAFRHTDGRFEFDSTDEGQRARAKVEEGHLTDISAGYQIDPDRSIYIADGQRAEHDGVTYEGPVVIRTWWRLNEGSLTPIGADDEAKMRGFRSMAAAREQQRQEPETAEDTRTGGDAGGGRSDSGETPSEAGRTQAPPEKKPTTKVITMSEEKEAPALSEEERAKIVAEAQNDAAKAFRKRELELTQIRNFMNARGVGDADEWIEVYRTGSKADVPIGQVRAEMQDHPFWSSDDGAPTEPERTAALDLTEKEAKRYSLTRAMLQLADGKLDGIEKEVSDAIGQRSGMETQGLFLARADDLRMALPEYKRDLTTLVPASAGDLVGTDHRDDEFIDFLRPRPIFTQLGARMLTGITGANLAIPRQDSGAVAGWSIETADHAQSELTVDQLTLKPYEVGCFAKYSRKLLVQSAPDVETLVRADFNNAVTQAFNIAGFEGSGTNEPTGVINVTGVTELPIGTAGQPTWAEIVQLEETVETGNALDGSLSYVTTPAGKSHGKTTLKDTGVSGYLWAGNEVNGYNAVSTNLVSANTWLFGNFADYIYGIWDGVDIVVDPYSQAEGRLIKYTINMMADGNGRHGASWAKMALV